MKFLATAFLSGAAYAVVTPEQQIVIAPGQLSSGAVQISDSISSSKPFRAAVEAIGHVSDAAHEASNSISSFGFKQLEELSHALKSLTSDAEQLWDDIITMFPESMDKSAFFSPPKPHIRRHDSEWDHIIRGADIQNVWVQTTDGAKERAIDGKLENYNMRVKKVDPKALGVDTVKQYSGYLDDEEEDKHLFYCQSLRSPDS